MLRLGPPLLALTGRASPRGGKVVKTLCFGAKNYFCTFLLAAVSKPILGVNFLAANCLLVDPFSRTVLHAHNLKPVGTALAAAAAHFVSSLCHIVPTVRNLLAEFPAIVGDSSGTPSPRHGIQHFMETTGFRQGQAVRH